MVDCDIKVKTYENGKCLVRSYVGKMDAAQKSGAKVSFRDENGDVEIFVSSKPYMRRRGEYSLDFTFKKGEAVPAEMRVGRNESRFPLYTEEYAYSVTESSARMYIKYYLDFGKERQNLKVILTASVKDRFK